MSVSLYGIVIKYIQLLVVGAAVSVQVNRIINKYDRSKIKLRQCCIIFYHNAQHNLGTYKEIPPSTGMLCSSSFDWLFVVNTGSYQGISVCDGTIQTNTEIPRCTRHYGDKDKQRQLDYRRSTDALQPVRMQLHHLYCHKTPNILLKLVLSSTTDHLLHSIQIANSKISTILQSDNIIF